MVTKDLGWSAAGFRAARLLALTASVSVIALAFSANPALAQAKKGRDKVVELNKQALASYDAKDYQAAKEALTKALKEAKQSNLEDDKMTARTYLHLGAVYWTGFHDQAMALENFTLAKRIRPDIQLTPQIETAELQSVFDLATVEPEAAPSVSPAPHASRTSSQASAPVVPTSAPAQRGSSRSRSVALAVPESGAAEGGDDGEPDLPTSMSAPLMCAVPEEAAPGKELTIRCALKPGVRGKVVQLHHRAPGEETYKSLDMERTPKGWYLATLPAQVLKGESLQLYFDARDGNDKEVASNGHPDSPSTIEIRKKGQREAVAGHEVDPMERLRNQAKEEKYEAGLHRRRQGAIWIGFGGGGGWGYAPQGNLEWEKSIKVSAVTTSTGMFDLMPELGYMWSDDFALALQARWEYIKTEQAYYNGQLLANPLKGAPTNQAFALFLRGIKYIDISSGGNFRFSCSADVGGGFIRFPVKPVGKTIKDSQGNDVPDPTQSIYETDTRPVGMVLVGASGGFLWNLSRHFAISAEARVLTGLPDFGLVIEGTLSAQVAFLGKAGPSKKATDEDEEEEAGPGGSDKDESSPSDSSAEE
jgi:tetratricopeptide (TPR) repeat protein